MNKMVTELVKEYLSNGYELYLGNNAHGSQSREVFAIHLTNDNGKTVVKVYGTLKRSENRTRELHVVAEEFNNKGGDITFWNDHGENKKTLKIYYIYETNQLNDKRLYIEDKEEFDRLIQLKRQRNRNKEDDGFEFKSEKAKKIALKLIKKKKGYKSTKLKEITKVVRRYGQYKVYLDGMGWTSIK